MVTVVYLFRQSRNGFQSASWLGAFSYSFMVALSVCQNVWDVQHEFPVTFDERIGSREVSGSQFALVLFLSIWFLPCISRSIFTVARSTKSTTLFPISVGMGPSSFSDTSRFHSWLNSDTNNSWLSHFLETSLSTIDEYGNKCLLLYVVCCA